MPEYYVRTNSDSVIGIKADRYSLEGGNELQYAFHKDGKIVATFNYLSVLGVFDEEVFLGESSALEDETEDETEDECFDCRLQDFLESEDFFGTVWDIVEAWHVPDEDTPPEAEEPVPQAKESYPIEHWRDYATDEEWWGFRIPKGFVHFPSEESAKKNWQYVVEDIYGDWSYKDLTGFTKVED